MPPAPHIRRSRLLLAWLLRPTYWSLVGLFWLLVFRVVDILLGGNFHVVRPGACYRGSQPSSTSIEQIIRDHQIGTVVNLRGFQDKSWFYAEEKVASDLGVKIVHIGLWSSSPPEVPEFRNLVRTLAHDPGPFFLHCHTGSDRTGLGSALFLLLRTDASLEDAQRQLSLYFGHLAWVRASCQDLLLQQYGAWLKKQGRPHSPAAFEYWALEVYDGTLAGQSTH